MIVKLDEHATYIVKFMHNNPHNDPGSLYHNNPAAMGNYGQFGTYCYIKEFVPDKKGEDLHVVSVGQAVLSPNDWGKFDKKIGRKIALTRALKVFTALTKDQRKVFWDQYLKESATPA